MYFFVSTIIFSILNIINIFFVSYFKKYSKYSLVLGTIAMIFSIVQIIIINISCSYSIKRIYYDSLEVQNKYFTFIFERNLLFALVAIILATILYIISYKIKYNLFHTIAGSIMTIIYFYLMLFKGIIIEWTYINFSLMMFCLITYYVNFISIPLLMKKYREHFREKNC